MPCRIPERRGVRASSRPTPGFGRGGHFSPLGRKLTRVSGTTPTPKGPVKRELRRRRGDVPRNDPRSVTARFGIPKVERTIRSITVNSVLGLGRRLSRRAGYQRGRAMQPEFVVLPCVQPGSYDCRFPTRNVAAQLPTPPCRSIPSDLSARTSPRQGNWGGVYGRTATCYPITSALARTCVCCRRT